MTDDDTPNTQDGGAFNDFRAGVNLTDDGNASNGTYNPQVGASTLATGLTEGTWYNLWMVVDNANDTMDLYLNGGISKPTVGDKINGSPVAFMNGTANAIDRFVVSGSGQVNGNQLTACVDDINLDAGAVSAALFFDDFETYAANASNITAGPWTTAAGSGATRTVRDDGTATPFGSNNQYLEMDDANTSDDREEWER